MSDVAVYEVRSHGPSRLREAATLSTVSLPRVTAFSAEASEERRSRLVTSIEPVCQTKAGRIALIRAVHRRMVRAGLFDFAEPAR